ncbi:MAG: YidC/Oxa1 family membrane protein insertase [Candidatus Margulisiibacteriota bacterium]|jgi:YidC/Oxa1 family membrane protein insertase
MFDFIINGAMIPFLDYSYHHIFPNYGLAIILLTLLVKIIFYPLTKKQFEAMKKNQKLQPLIKEIQDKYKGQPEKSQKELMKFWKENKFNPLSGCLPALLQLPIFLSIFWTINSPAFKNLLAQPGINPGFLPFWIPDLSLADHTMILPILISLLTYLSQKSFNIDPKQASIFLFMPFIMFIVSWKMPGGVLLYWGTSTLISWLQQLWIMRDKPEKKSPQKLIENKGVESK